MTIDLKIEYILTNLFIPISNTPKLVNKTQRNYTNFIMILKKNIKLHLLFKWQKESLTFQINLMIFFIKM